jgi:membrane peptidoglycan carboxypeptidase
MPSSTRDLEADALITLGKARISAINMANTYATIANGGQRADVHVIDKVTLSDGTVKYQYKPHTTQAVDPDVNADVSYAMQQVVQHGTGTNAQAVGRPAAGKTGTATNSLDQVSSSWFVGFTPQMSTAVMYVRGDGDNQLDGWLPPYNGAAGYFGAGYPTATWAAIMKRDLLGQPIEKFPPPANVPAKQTDHAPAPTFTPPPPTHHTSRPSSAPTSSAPTSSAPTHGPSSTATGSPTCFPPGHCHSSSATPTPTPTLTPTPTPTVSASARPFTMQAPWW